MESLPVIDVSPLLGGGDKRAADAIGAACRELGFFYATGHAIGADTLSALDRASRKFFALPESQKMKIAMARGGRAWRGYFPVGGELTSGKPDSKQGLYFGQELGADDPRVRAGLALHGANLFPDAVPELKPAVLRFMDEATRSAHAIMQGVALSLGLDAQYFRRTYTADPTLLFRVFEYPADDGEGWGVGEHTDYGLLTLLAQDENGGLQVKTPNGWIEAPPIEGALVCNIGDMLDRLTGGVYRSTPHRVRNISGKSRLSFPFFFDPGWNAEIVPLPAHANAHDDSRERWDRANVHAFSGTYGQYLLSKVSKVFPDLARDVTQ
ncbi:MAG: isopenicillin N synthase family oxygenase [Hyphomonadaceae bacterium]|jgi:isopenicillin N synthase-like dioxygenase|nr:isopenicillin N synthase family oxygenase [Hyphomonadaceae bacterium]